MIERVLEKIIDLAFVLDLHVFSSEQQRLFEPRIEQYLVVIVTQVRAQKMSERWLAFPAQEFPLAFNVFDPPHVDHVKNI
jgi:hypothetical protein